jgi:hypothetical protein
MKRLKRLNMNYILEKLKDNIVSIWLIVLITFSLGLLIAPSYALYSQRVILSNTVTTTGTIDLEVQSVESINEGKEVREIKVKNIGTLPLKYKVEKLNISNGCEYIQPTIDNDTLPQSSLGVGNEDILNLEFSRLVEDNINCEVKIHLIAWQQNNVEPVKGFTDKEILKIQIIFKKENTKVLELNQEAAAESGDMLDQDTAAQETPQENEDLEEDLDNDSEQDLSSSSISSEE